MKFRKAHKIQPIGLAGFIFAAFLIGCSSEQEADPVVIPDQSEDARSVIFDKDGVVEVREGGKLVFQREGSLPERLTPSPTSETASVSAVDSEPGDRVAHAQKQTSSHVPPKLMTTIVDEKPLSEEIPATLEPLPEKTVPLVPKTTYAVQVGFFGQRSNAENLRDVLTNNDWPVRLIKIEKKGGKLFYLVVVPVRGNRERAIAAKAKIQKQHRLDGIVIRSDSLPD